MRTYLRVKGGHLVTVIGLAPDPGAMP
jgi:hypothetical protein